MKNSAIAVWITLFFIWLAPVQAEPVNTLSLDQAIETAITNNPQLQATRARVGISQAEITKAGSRINPVFISDNGIAEKTYRIGVQQTIELGGKRQKRVALANAQRDVLLAEINTSLLDLRTNVRRSYTELYNNQQRQEAYREILLVTERLLNISRKREHEGDIASVDVLGAEIATLTAKNEFKTVTYQIVESRNKLNALLNQSLNQTVLLSPPTPYFQINPTLPTQTTPLQGSVGMADANLDNLIDTALARRPEIQQNLRNQTVAQRQLVLSKANRIPNFILSAGPDLVFEGGADTRYSAFIIGNLDIPIFNQQQGPIQEALARSAQLEREQAALKNQITLEVSNAYNSLMASQERLKGYETEILPKGKEVVYKSQRSFEEGKASILLPINAQQAYINSRLGYLQSLLDYQNAISDLERAVGTGL